MFIRQIALRDVSGSPYILTIFIQFTPGNMRKTLLLVALALFLVACAPVVPATQDVSNPPAATATPDSMTADNPEADHMMEPISASNVPLATETEGVQPLTFGEENGVKVFELTTKAVQWPILDGITIIAFTYNGTVPGSMMRVTEGDQVRIVVKNELPDATTVHWHAVEVPNAMDGVPGITQDSIEPGESFTYEFVDKPAGTFIYHSHFEGDVQVSAGLYAPFIIDPQEPEENPPAVDKTLMISESLIRDGQTFAPMPMTGMEPNFFTINGMAVFGCSRCGDILDAAAKVRNI